MSFLTECIKKVCSFISHKFYRAGKRSPVTTSEEILEAMERKVVEAKKVLREVLRQYNNAALMAKEEEGGF